MEIRRTILIVDDEPYMREILAQILSEHYKVYLAKNGIEAQDMAKAFNPAVIVLDMLMPGITGIETCQAIRKCPQTKDVPIVMLTAVNEPEIRVKAFEAGADDYLSKPFLPEELLARISRKIQKSVSRKIEKPNELMLGDLTLQFDDFSLVIKGISQDLGSIEFKILNYLIKKRGTLVSRQELNDFVWGAGLPSERALDPHITSLRKKISSSTGELKTVYGKGYSIILKDAEF